METPQGSAHAVAAAAAAGPESPLTPPLSPATAAAAAMLTAARWNPTMEQMAVLERLFEHGLRTPTAEQIQHITGRLREHGPVEEKNVFYWFQNHKARHRQQRQKQESFAYFTRLLRRPPPLPVITRLPGQPHPLAPMQAPPVMTMAPPPAASNNGGAGTHVTYRAPYYVPAPAPQAPAANAAGGYYNLQQAAHHMAVVYPRMESAQDKQMNPAGMYQQAAPYGTSNSPLHVVPPANGGGASTHRVRGETLELFPLRPTFLLPEPDTARGASLTLPTPSAAPASVCGDFETEILVESPNSNAEALPFYDFFGLQSSAGR